MKSLVESILDSTKTGAKGLIKTWLDKYYRDARKISGELKGWGNPNEDPYEFTKDFRITNRTYKDYGENTKLPLWFLYDADIPANIKFDKHVDGLRIGDIINKLSKDQMPESVNNLQLLADYIDVLDIKIGDTIEFNSKRIKGIDIEFTDRFNFHKSDHYEIIFDYMKIPFEDIKNIHITADKPVEFIINYRGFLTDWVNLVTKLTKYWNKDKERFNNIINEVFGSLGPVEKIVFKNESRKSIIVKTGKNEWEKIK